LVRTDPHPEEIYQLATALFPSTLSEDRPDAE